MRMINAQWVHPKGEAKATQPASRYSVTTALPLRNLILLSNRAIHRYKLIKAGISQAGAGWCTERHSLENINPLRAEDVTTLV